MSESLSITYLVPHDPFSSTTMLGASVFTGELAMEMARRGHDVTIIHSYVQISQNSFIRGVHVSGIPNYHYPYVGGWTANLAVSKFLAASAKKSGADIIDARGGGLGWAFSRNAPHWSARVFHVVDVTLKEWERLPLRTRFWSAPKYFMLAHNDRLCVQVADWIVAETTAVRKELTKLYPGASSKMEVIPGLVPRSWASSETVLCDPFHFLYVGAGPRRDTGLFLKALHILYQQGVPVKATVLREERQRFRLLAQGWKLNVRFETVLSNDEMRKALAGSCAFVLPSFREAYCGTVIEAAFHGTPSIVSDLAPVRDFVRHKQNGIIVPSCNPKDWASAFRMLIEDPGLRKRLGEAARTLATQAYSAERIGELTERGYRNVLSRIDRQDSPHQFRSFDSSRHSG